jgi:competence protein ComEC
MPLFVIPFVVAVVVVVRLPVPVDPSLLGMGVPLAFFSITRWRLQPFAGVFLGMFHALYIADQKLAAELPESLVGRDLVVTGVIKDLPSRNPDSVRFRMRLLEAYTDEGSMITEGQIGDIAVSCYGCSSSFHPGEVWRLTLRLSKPSGSANRGLFDYEGWQFMQDIAARGYVRNPETAVRVGRRLLTGLHHRLRGSVRVFLQDHAGDEHRGLILALAIGASTDIDPQDWRVLSDTGTNHLFVISGLHVGLISAITYRIARSLALPIRTAGFLTLCFSGFYAALAGLGLPVQRAWMMAGVVVVSSMLARRASVMTMFLWALAGVVLIEPFAVLGVGFWLSFGAVFSLLYAMTARYPVTWGSTPVSWLRDAIRTQWAVTLGTMPILVHLLYQWAWLALPANLIAIPWLSCLVVPPLLLVTLLIPLLPDLAALLLVGVEWSLDAIWQYLTLLSALELVLRPGHAGWAALACAVVGVFFGLAPRGLGPKWLVLLCLAPLLGPELRHHRGLEVTFLDIGQGLSVLVRLHDRVMLYDAGPRFRSGFDAGEQIVTPYLRTLGIRIIDHFIISHGDHDHAGGAPAVLRNFPVRRIHTSHASDLYSAESCRLAHPWQIEDYELTVFSAGVSGGGNDQSCLLRISLAGRNLLLLTGDIEESSELALASLERGNDVTVAVMSIPHHGSLSSSSPALLNRLRPDLAVVSAGRNNTFGHPHARVMSRYENRHTRTLNTAYDGAVTVTIEPDMSITVVRARTAFDRLWHK